MAAVDALGYVTTYAYAGASDLAGGHYGLGGLKNPATDRRGNVTHFTDYDNYGDLLRSVDAAGTQQQFVQSSIAPSGFRNLSVSADGLHVYATAPNANPDPNGAHAWTNLPGSLIDIDLTPTLTGGDPVARSIPGSRGTYDVAVTPGREDAAFTNAEADAAGVMVTMNASGQKQVIPLDLDKLASAGNSQLSVHNASGIVFTPDGSYAFITGRADQVNSVVGGGFNEVGLNATGVSGFLDQTANPLYADGNVGIIKIASDPIRSSWRRPGPFPSASQSIWRSLMTAIICT